MITVCDMGLRCGFTAALNRCHALAGQWYRVVSRWLLRLRPLTLGIGFQYSPSMNVVASSAFAGCARRVTLGDPAENSANLFKALQPAGCDGV